MCAQTLRGQGGDVVYVDEMAYVNPDLFFRIIVPLLEVDTTVLIAISTLVNVWNFFSVLLNLLDENGAHVFNVFSQRLVCDRCMGTKTQENCKHNYYAIPPWKSEGKLKIAKLIYGDDIVALKRESLYVVFCVWHGCGDGERCARGSVCLVVVL